MTSRRVRLFWVGLGFTVYVIALYWFDRFLEADRCLDAGGSFDYTLSACDHPRDSLITLGEASWGYWFFLVTVPATPIALATFLIRRALYPHA